MLAIGHQVKVIGELDRLGDLLKDVDAETLAAALDVDAGVDCLIADDTGELQKGERWVWVCGGA